MNFMETMLPETALEIVQHVTDQYLKYRTITLDEMCAVIDDVGAHNLAEQYKKTDHPAFSAGPDGFVQRSATK